MNNDSETPNGCMTCGTVHGLSSVCPGELQATGDERTGWTILARTPTGPERYEVLLAPAHDLWRARIRTYPNVMWLAPGGQSSLKFAERTRLGAERKAIDFIERHCVEKGFRMQREAAALWANSPVTGDEPAQRKIRFLPIRFGLGGPSENAGTGNLSETGMFVVTDTPVEAGQRVRLVLEIDKSLVPLFGHVRWSRTEYDVGGVPGMGLELMAPPRPYLRFVRNLS